MDVLFNQLSSHEAKKIFQNLDGSNVVLWIWEKGDSAKKIPINASLNKDFSFLSDDELFPDSLKRSSLLGTFEFKGFYYFLKLLSREVEGKVQLLCDPIIHRNERRRRKRFQIVPKAQDYVVVIPLKEAPPVEHPSQNVFSFLPIKLFKNFLNHLSTVSDGKPLYHLYFPLYDISDSGLSLLADELEANFICEKQMFEEVTLVLNKEKCVIKNLFFVHRSVLNPQEGESLGKKGHEVYRLGMRFECDDWTVKKIKMLLEHEREMIVKEFDQWSKN